MTENKSLLSTILVIIIVGLCFFWFRQAGPGLNGTSDISEKDIVKHIRFLSDDKRAGRYPGTRGSKDVIAYLINQLKSYGVQPAGEGSSFKQTFSILDSVKIGRNNSLKINDRPLNIEKDYIPLWFSGNSSVSAEVVFAGYGINLISDSLVWNDYKDLNVDGKWVMVMRHSPERENPHSVYAPHSDLHKKMIEARDRGAVGIIFISQVEDSTLIPFKYIPGYSKSGIPAIHINNEVADDILNSIGSSRKVVQDKMNSNLKPESFKISDVKISANVELKNIYSYFKKKNGYFWVIEKNKKIIGSMGIAPLKRNLELHKVYITKKERRKGLARKLVLKAEKFGNSYKDLLKDSFFREKLCLKKNSMQFCSVRNLRLDILQVLGVYFGKAQPGHGLL